MIDLFHTLQSSDLGYLKMVAGLWGIELQAPDVQTAMHSLVKAMLKPQLVNEILTVLPAEASFALQELMKNDGILPWALFTSQHGEVRSMGPARRDRERPDLYPDSAAEVLWYRGLIGRAFLDLEQEPQEYAYIPDDLVPYMITLLNKEEKRMGRPASPKETAVIQPANDRILDDVCTLLAALRSGIPPREIPAGFLGIPSPFLVALLKSTGMVEEDLDTQPEAVRMHLEEPRGVALAQLVETWFNSQKVNELRMLPHLKFEGTWVNHPLETRRTILELVSSLEEGTWWSLGKFISSVQKHHPDFQRPAGDYDSWFVLEKESGEYLKGRVSWEKVDGALLRFMICGPMHWLGLMDLSRTESGAEVSAFRISKWAQNLWHGSAPPGLPAEEDSLVVNRDGRIRLSNRSPRAVRYQIARLGEWQERRDQHYIYRVTPKSLQQAHGQGLRPQHLISLLKKHAGGGMPPSFLDALNRWEKSGTEAKLFSASLLRVERPEILNQLLQSPAKRYLGEVLNPTTVEVKRGAEESVQNALFQLGFLSETSSSFSVTTSDPSS